MKRSSVLLKRYSRAHVNCLVLRTVLVALTLYSLHNGGNFNYFGILLVFLVDLPNY